MGRALVIGYGNRLRSDDGLGPRVIELLEERGTGVDTLSAHQLTPEMAEPVSRADTVIFVDARCDCEPGALSCIRVEPGDPRSPDLGHRLEPAAVLGMARALYGRCPDAYALSIGAASFAFDEALSPEVEARLPDLVKRLLALLSGD